MRNLALIFLATTFIIPCSYSAPVASLFGTQSFTPNKRHTVTGPLVQFKTAGGTTLSFQHGARFQIDDAGTVTLQQGNLRVGPAGTEPLTIQSPQGPVTVAPLTALTITANPQETSGRIYQGNLITENRTFTTGQGFVLTASGARGTFAPAPAQAPAMENLADLSPASGPAPGTPPMPRSSVVLPSANLQQEPAAKPAQAAPATPAAQPSPAPGTTPQPQPEAIPEPQPEPEITPAPLPEPEPTPEPTPQPEPTPEPEPEQATELPPTPITRSGLYATWSETLEGIDAPTNKNTSSGAFSFNEYTDGTQTLEATRSGRLTTTSTLLRGTADNLDTATYRVNDHAVAGLGRWVGGELTTVNTTSQGSTQATLTHTTATDTPTPTPNSLHYVWGEKPTAIPTSGRAEYALFSATQPTYVTQPGAPGLASQGASFTGNLAINFARGYGGVVGTYHLNGTVTMPQTTQTETGPVTTPTTYTITTPAQGGTLNGSHFSNMAHLNVTAPEDAVACPTGSCTGTVNVGGFGAGMASAGAVYSINPEAPVAITGAALFTATP